MLYSNRVIISDYKDIGLTGPRGKPDPARVVLRYDDRCKNGHNSFSITLDATHSGGCMHDEIAQHWPECAHLIKWHLMSDDGPMHYVANTLWHSSAKDHNGLLAGEVRQLRNGRTGEPVWQAVVFDKDGIAQQVKGYSWIDSPVKPENDGNIEWIAYNQIGEGKPIDLEAARHCAIAPNATLEQLQDKDWLLARLPQLIADFHADMAALSWPKDE